MPNVICDISEIHLSSKYFINHKDRLIFSQILLLTLFRLHILGTILGKKQPDYDASSRLLQRCDNNSFSLRPISEDE